MRTSAVLYNIDDVQHDLEKTVMGSRDRHLISDQENSTESHKNARARANFVKLHFNIPPSCVEIIQI